MKGKEAAESIDEMGGYMDILNLHEPLEMKGIVDEERCKGENGEHCHFPLFLASKPTFCCFIPQKVQEGVLLPLI